MTVQNMVPEYTILGSFGELYDSDNNFLSNVQNIAINITVNRQEINMSGTRRVGYKYTSITGDGTMSGFKVTSLMARRIAAPMANDRSPQWVGSLRCVLRDPETVPVLGGAVDPTTGAPLAQYEEVQLTRCKWWGVNLGWAVNQIVEEATPFTFQNIQWITPIQDNATHSAATTPPSPFVPLDANLP